MTEVARTRVNTSDVERGVVPEVAELGNVLKELFNRLGITQTQYAYRVHLHKSVVSRCLNGQRLAGPEFIERLITEVEDHVGKPLKLEAKEAIQALRLKALGVTNPDEFRLEQLRGELARSRRDTERAHRNIEALHDLLAKREAEVRSAADELDQLRLDWGAEIARLRQDLQDAECLRLDAERRSEGLRDEVLRLEEELSRRSPEGGGTGLLPLEAFQEQLEAMWEADEFAEAARELTEAAWSRPLAEAAELLHWLAETEPRRPVTAETLVGDVARLRPLEDLLVFATHVADSERVNVETAWLTAVASRLTDRNAAAVYRGLRDVPVHALFRGESYSQAEGVLGEYLRSGREPAEAVGVLLAALADVPMPVHLVRVPAVLASGRPFGGARYGIRIVAGLALAGRTDVATLAVTALCRMDRPAFTYSSSYVDIGFGIKRLDDDGTDALFGLVAGLDDTAVRTRFAAQLAAARQPALLDRLFVALEAHGVLDSLDVHAERGYEKLAVALERWRRSGE